jgi:hypothetical protein
LAAFANELLPSGNHPATFRQNADRISKSALRHKADFRKADLPLVSVEEDVGGFLPPYRFNCLLSFFLSFPAI